MNEAALIDRLTGEFAENAAAAGTQPLAILGRGLVLLQPPDGLPVLHREIATGRFEPVLDFAAEKPAGAEFLLGGVALSPDGERIAYTVDGAGDDRHELRVRPLTPDGEAETLRYGVSAPVAWHPETGEVCYVTLDDTMRPAQVRVADRLLYDCEDLSAYVDIVVSGDGRTLFVAVERHGARDLLVVDRAARGVRPLWTAGERVLADATADRWILLRGGAELLIADRAEDPPRWRTTATAPPGATWEDLAVAGDAAFVVERGGGRQRLLRAGPGEALQVTPADPASIAIVPAVRRPGDGVDVIHGSWQLPETWLRTGPGGDGPLIAHSRPASSNIDVTVLTVMSRDGTPVPLTLLRPSGTERAVPTVLYAYGAYGVAVDPRYSPFRESLFRRGVAFAVAHVRGGGDQGPAWHDAGRGPGKLHAVDDYLACAGALVGQGWTSPDGLVARSRSAGAAIVGAALNRAPERFAAAVLEVPFLDCLATLSDPDLPLTSLEWEEWGNPLTDPAAAAALADLSPVANVRSAPYPPLLLTAGASDSRVTVDEALRYADAVRAASTSGAPVVVKVDDSGHLGHSDVAADHRDEAHVLAFILEQLGVV